MFIINKGFFAHQLIHKEWREVKNRPLNYKRLRTKLNYKKLNFTTTKELKPLSEFIGQKRALDALMFGIHIDAKGYNLYAMGPTGIGKRSLIKSVLKKHASKLKTPPDWCYIHNFEFPDKPIAVKLKPGLGTVFKEDMRQLITAISDNLHALLKSDEYHKALIKIDQSVKKSCEDASKKIIENEDKEISSIFYREKSQKEKALQTKFTLSIVQPLVRKLKIKYKQYPVIIHYLRALQEDIINHVDDFMKDEKSPTPIALQGEHMALFRYQVNVLVDNSKRKGAPVIFAYNPSYSNLLCRVEYAPQFGTLATNFMLIRSGALHRANGGFIIIEAHKIKKAKAAWEGLKRALYMRKIKIEPLEHLSEVIRQVSIDPMSIPLHVKVVLIGRRATYFALNNQDPDFSELFKVPVDFYEEVKRDAKNIKLFARLITKVIKKKSLRPFHASAVARMIDQCSRLAEDVEKLSTHMRTIDDLAIEANYWASVKNKKIVNAEDVERALSAQIYRMDRARELYYEDIKREFVRIKTKGVAVGQINCLSVVKVGNFLFGHPTCLTGKIRLGKGQFIDIQREIKMAGPMLTKGGLIISNYLASQYNLAYPFAIAASLSFEQIYGTIDGDSAAIAEICVLLSAIADLPLKQSLAITGSVNQYGHVQVIGGVNEKIEGFYDVCKARGLTGEQGVLIPAENVKNLMLREDVVNAAQEHKFAVYTIKTVDDAIALLTGRPAGVRRKDGSFPPHSVNDIIEKKLLAFSERYMKSFTRPKPYK